jgi:dolichyl-phosphate beta-glucosyltransferase
VTSLVFPAYNPGPLAARTAAAAAAFLRNRTDAWEILFVLDGCTDGSADTLDRLVGHDARFRILSYTPNRGKGYAVRTGLAAARGDIRIFTDVDLAYSFDDVARIADEVRAGADVAIASREHPDSTIQLPPRFLRYAYRRRVQSHVFSTLTRLLLPLPHRDTQAGLKGMTAAVADALLPELTCNGFGFDCELLTAARRLELQVVEVPVCVRFEDAASTTGIKTMLRMLRDLYRIRRNWSGRVLPRFQRPAAVPAERRAA